MNPWQATGYHQSGSVEIALQLSRLQRSGLVDMDPWQAPGYHQFVSVEMGAAAGAAVPTSAVWTGRH